jgi:hypothetical protein
LEIIPEAIHAIGIIGPHPRAMEEFAELCEPERDTERMEFNLPVYVF